MLESSSRHNRSRSTGKGRPTHSQSVDSASEVHVIGGSATYGKPLQIQQGDLLMVRIGPPQEVPSRKKRLVLQRGELTGHSHVLEGRILRHATDPRIIVVGGDGATLTHQEHKALVIPPGTYRLGRVREYCYDYETLQSTSSTGKSESAEEEPSEHRPHQPREMITSPKPEQPRDSRGRFVRTRISREEKYQQWRYIQD